MALGKREGFFGKLWNKVKQRAVSTLIDIVGVALGGFAGLLVAQAVKQMLNMANFRVIIPNDIEEKITDSDAILIEKWNDEKFSNFIKHISNLIDSGNVNSINTALQQLAVYENALENSAKREDASFGLSSWGLLAKYGYAVAIFDEIRNVVGPGKTTTISSSATVSQLQSILGAQELKNIDANITLHTVVAVGVAPTKSTTTNINTSVSSGDSKSAVVKDVVTATVKLDSQVSTIGSTEPIKATVVTKETPAGEIKQDTIIHFDSPTKTTVTPTATPTSTPTKVCTNKTQQTEITTTSEPLVEEVEQEEIPNTEKSKGGQVVKWGFAALAILAIVKIFKK
jgi:hypothetical protein